MTVTVLGGALSLLAVSCGGDSEEAEDNPRPTTTERETTTTLDPEEVARQEVIAAREAADDAWLAATDPPAADPDDPGIAEHYTDRMLDRLTETARGLKRNGFALRLPADSQHRLTVDSVRFDTADGQEIAVLKVCTVDDGERFVISTGEVLSSGLQTIEAEEAMRKVDGVWKVAERREDNVYEGVVECTAE